MILALLLVVLLVSGLACLSGKKSSFIFAKAVAYLGLAIAFGLTIFLGIDIFQAEQISGWVMEFELAWIPSWHVNFHLGIDSFSYWLIFLTLIMGFCAIFVSQPKYRANSYFAAIMWAVFSVVGLFMSADIFLFFIFWELALFPLYWLLVSHSPQMNMQQIIRFIVLTQLSGLFLLVSVVGLALAHYHLSGAFTFDYRELLKTALPESLQHYLLLGFLLAFLIKLPVLPFHGWMPAIFGEGSTPVVLVGILVKTAVFGLVRFSWTLFPVACANFSVTMMALGAATVVYGAVLAFGQTNPMRILAYGTLSHAGLLLIGIFCQSRAGFFGVLLLLTASALSTGAMLMMFDRAQIGTIDLSRGGGLWERSPKFSTILLIMLLAGMGFPIFGNFLGEWLILWAAFVDGPLIAGIASLGIVLSAAYSLRMFQRLCFRAPSSPHTNVKVSDLAPLETTIYGGILVMILTLGLYSSIALEHIRPPYTWAVGQNSQRQLELGSAISYPQVVSP